MMCALERVRCITGCGVVPGPRRKAAEPGRRTKPSAPRWKSTSRNLSSLFISVSQEVCFGEEEELGAGVFYGLAARPRRTVRADDVEQLALLVFEEDHLEGELHDGTQVGVVPRLADEAKDFALVDGA